MVFSHSFAIGYSTLDLWGEGDFVWQIKADPLRTPLLPAVGEGVCYLGNYERITQIVEKLL